MKISVDPCQWYNLDRKSATAAQLHLLLLSLAGSVEIIFGHKRGEASTTVYKFLHLSTSFEFLFFLHFSPQNYPENL